MRNIRNAVLAGVTFGIVLGIFLTFSNGLNSGLMVGSLCGILFGLFMYLFVSSKKIKIQTQINSDKKEIIYSGEANHFVNAEGVGGQLFLLKDKIVFKSHGFNIQNHEQVIELNEIKEVAFFNTLGLIPNGLKIVRANNIAEKFVVNKRRHWKNEISKIKTMV